MKPAPEPAAKPPPSDFCRSTKPIMESTIMRWTTMTNFSMEPIRKPEPPPGDRPSYRASRACLHDPPGHFYGSMFTEVARIERSEMREFSTTCHFVPDFAALNPGHGLPKPTTPATSDTGS